MGDGRGDNVIIMTDWNVVWMPTRGRRRKRSKNGIV